MTYYKEIAGKQRQFFKPVELVLDASSISEYHHGKRHRDTSLPSIKRMRMPIKHQHLKASSFIYDNNNNDFENESTLSDFISDRAHEQRESQFSSYNRQSTHYNDERERHIKIEQKLPAMEMTIDLKAAPTIESNLKNVSVYEGQMAKLECVVSGKPNPTVKWYKEGKEIEESASDEITITYESSSGVATLIIHKITISDSAKYTCVARNALGSCSTSAFINVQGKNVNAYQPFTNKHSSSYANTFSSNKSFYNVPEFDAKQYRSQFSTDYKMAPSPNYMWNAESNRSVKTSTHLIPNQGTVSQTPIYHKNNTPIQSFQQIIPKRVSSYAQPSYNRSRSYEDSDSEQRFTNKFSTSPNKNSFSNESIYNTKAYLPEQEFILKPNISKPVQSNMINLEINFHLGLNQIKKSRLNKLILHIQQAISHLIY